VLFRASRVLGVIAAPPPMAAGDVGAQAGEKYKLKDKEITWEEIPMDFDTLARRRASMAGSAVSSHGRHARHGGDAPQHQ